MNIENEKQKQKNVEKRRKRFEHIRFVRVRGPREKIVWRNLRHRPPVTVVMVDTSRYNDLVTCLGPRSGPTVTTTC